MDWVGEERCDLWEEWWGEGKGGAISFGSDL